MARQELMITLNPKKLARLAAISGLTKTDLAQAAGLCPLSITRCFAGREVGVRVARKVAKALGTPIKDIAEPEDDRTPSTETSRALSS